MRSGAGVVGFNRLQTRYATIDQVSNAVAAVRWLPQPWFVWLAFSAPHQPYHDPPPQMHTQDLDPTKPDLLVRRFKAMKEAMDHQIGRLLAYVPPDTTIIFIGDNGTPKETTTSPFRSRRAKGTIYEGGIHVPMIVTSPRITQPGTECDALVNSTDLLATVAEIAGAPHGSPDSESFLPYLTNPSRASIRRFAYAEFFLPIGLGPYTRFERAIRDSRYKLVRRFRRQGLGIVIENELYDLQLDPFEFTDLLAGTPTVEQLAARDVLSAAHGDPPSHAGLPRSPGGDGLARRDARVAVKRLRGE